MRASSLSQSPSLERIQDVPLGQPCASRLQNPKTDFFQVGDMVRIRVDHDLDTTFFRHAEMNIVQVEAVWIRIQFHRERFFAASRRMASMSYA